MKRRPVIGVVILSLMICMNPLAHARSLDEAMISLTFDDGYASLFTRALPALNKYKLPATAYITPDFVGQGWTVTWSQLWQLYWTYGWEIANHTLNHPSLVGLSDAAVIEQIRGARSVFERHGLVNITALAPPFGDYDAFVLDVLRQDGTLYSSRRAWWDDVPVNTVATFSQWELITVGVDQAERPMTFATIKPYIDLAIAKKTWLILMFHDISSGAPVDYQFSLTELNKLATYLYNQRAKIKTVTVTNGVGKMLRYKNLP